MSYLSSCYYTHPKLLEAPHFKYNKVANLIGHIKPKLEKEIINFLLMNGTQQLVQLH